MPRARCRTSLGTDDNASGSERKDSGSNEARLVPSQCPKKSALLRRGDRFNFGTWLEYRRFLRSCFFFLMLDDCLNKRFVPRREDCFRRANGFVVGELNLAPAGNLEQRLRSTRGCAFGVHNLSVTQINNSAVLFLHD